MGSEMCIRDRSKPKGTEFLALSGPVCSIKKLEKTSLIVCWSTFIPKSTSKSYLGSVSGIAWEVDSVRLWNKILKVQRVLMSSRLALR